jgi:hypothetical protein
MRRYKKDNDKIYVAERIAHVYARSTLVRFVSFWTRVKMYEACWV